MYKIKSSKTKGFTLLEIVISITIFAFLTVLLVVKYGSFNKGILITNLAYDVALTLRNAQSYGLNVKSVPTDGSNYSNTFDKAYGVHFDSTSQNNKKMIFFADLNDNGKYDSTPTDEKISLYNIKNDFSVVEICIGANSSGCTGTTFSIVHKLNITFKRPDLDARIFGIENGVDIDNIKYAEIRLQNGSDYFSRKKVAVTSVGQISVIN